ncbi:MAG: hypothetical protein AAF714_09885 [Pseudomonadota bacterium]
MPDRQKTNPPTGAQRLLPEALKRTSRNRPGFAPRNPHRKGVDGGKTRGDRPPRFPGRTGGR